MIRQEIRNLIEKSIKELQKEGVFPKFEIPEIKVEQPEEKAHGDYSTNIAMIIYRYFAERLDSHVPGGKKQGIIWAHPKVGLFNNPSDVAKKIKEDIEEEKIFEKIEVATPGFINFFLSKEYLQRQVKEILKQKEKFGELKIGKKQKVNVEFISANPTGPLHIGNGRGGFCGDVLANILEKVGCKVYREYYVNDMGRQILFLENSLNKREPSYRNQYIDDLKARGEKNVKKAVEYIVSKIKETTEKMGIKFDRWFYESDLKKERKEVLKILGENKLTYEKEGALWFKSTQFGDDKDRVLKRSEEKTTYSEETYILSDTAYLKNKFKRGFDYLIFFLGAEHYGYVKRLKAVTEALGYNPERVELIIMQLVNLVEQGKEVRMSKRTGIYVTIDELIDEVGLNVARFFFLTRSASSHLIFDLDLAKEQSEKNPVYYVQYAYARISSILRKCKMQNVKCKITIQNLKLLNHPSELELIKQLIRFPEIIEDTAKDYQVQRIPQYALDLATSFHQFYRDCRVLTNSAEVRPLSDANSAEVRPLSEARLALVLATKIVLKNTLDLMGISAPERM